MSDVIVLTSESRKDKWKRRMIIARYLFPRILNIILLICGVALVIVGAKVINGSIPAPEFSYEQFMGIVIVMVGVVLLRFRVR